MDSIKDCKLLTEDLSITRIVHNAMLLNIHKNKNFLKKLFKQKKLKFFNSNEKIKVADVNDFFKFLDLFESKYKENFDLGFEYSYSEDCFKPYFKVLYPKFTITNSLNKHHVIEDLLVIHLVCYGNDHVYTAHPKGSRLSKTENEINSGYQQSHLPSHANWLNSPFNASRFCTGGDTDVSRMISEFEVELDWDRYELYLFCIDSMVKWESLEGVPHKKISTINTSNNLVNYVNLNKVNSVVSFILKTKLPLDLNFYIANNKYKIKPDEKANAFIKDIVLKLFQYDTFKDILTIRVQNTFDNFLEIPNVTGNSFNFNVTNDQYIIFRGKKVFPKLIKKNQRQQKSITVDDYIVYPKFLKHVLTELEYKIYERAIIKSGIKIYNSCDNANRSFTSDSISL